MVFISHNYLDKTIIEPIAIKLAEIFGKENVFYDSWSMQPGDGIIDKMNEGLEKATHFFFFVSKNSLSSNMVKMEWQNAIYKSTKGKCKVIPIRLDESSLPPIMAQSLYIDLYTNGIDATIVQMVNVIQGNSTFAVNSNIFSNLSYKLDFVDDEKIQLKISASHYLEPIPNFLILIENDEGELDFSVLNEGMFFGGFNKDVELTNGKKVNAHLIKNPRGITPKMPMIVEIKKQKEIIFKFVGVLHQTSESEYVSIPEKK